MKHAIVKRAKVTVHPRPSRCPICGGRGKLQVDFYAQIGFSTSTKPVTCKACDGWGVLVA